MKNKDFQKWCYNACWKIKYPPDRWAVEEELYEHLQERYEELTDRGLSHQEATQQTLEAMGDHKLIAEDLGRLHKPYWGWITQFLTLILAVMLCITGISTVRYFSGLEFDDPGMRKFQVYSEGSYGGDSGRTLLHLSQPDVSFSADGSTFTVTDAAVFTETVQGKEMTRLYLLIEQRTTLPWSAYARYMQPYRYYQMGAFFVEDSLGRRYASYEETGSRNAQTIQSSAQTGIFTYTHEFWINDFAFDGADWVEVRYDRDGRDHRLRICLNGGATS